MNECMLDVSLYNLAPIISLFLKRDVNYRHLLKLLAKKLIEELDMDLRPRVSSLVTSTR